MRDAEQAAAQDERALADYRAGHACHPLQPFVEWSACDAVAHRLGAVLSPAAATRSPRGSSASCRCTASAPRSTWRAAAARQRIGYLLAPPYVPLVVGTRPVACAVDAVIETQALTKQFGDRAAVDGVDLIVPAGVAFGFLGPNGAGKTTLIRTLRRPDPRDLRRGQPARAAAAGEARARRSHASARSSRSRVPRAPDRAART